MNLLEHYVKEIISEENVRKYDEDWVKVRLIINCYGVTEEKTELFLPVAWEKIKAQGYYMA